MEGVFWELLKHSLRSTLENVLGTQLGIVLPMLPEIYKGIPAGNSLGISTLISLVIHPRLSQKITP